MATVQRKVLFVSVALLVAVVTLVTLLSFRRGKEAYLSTDSIRSSASDGYPTHSRLFIQAFALNLQEDSENEASSRSDDRKPLSNFKEDQQKPKLRNESNDKQETINVQDTLHFTSLKHGSDKEEQNEPLLGENVVHNQRAPLTIELEDSPKMSNPSENSTPPPPPVSTSSGPSMPSFKPSKDLFIRAIYFDDRPRKNHRNASVFLVVVKKDISDKKLIVGCQVGSHIATNLEAKLIGETPLWRAFYNYINHEEMMVECYDLPAANGDMGYIMYKTSEDSKVETAASERPLVFPAPRIPPTTEVGKTYNMSVVTCAKIFNHPPWMKEWLQYQRTLGIDHVHLDAEDTFEKCGEMSKPYIQESLNEGFLSIDIWKKYLEPKELWYHNQGLIYEDCVYRYRGTYDYIVMVDTDDFFTPRVPGEPKIHYYIHKYCRDKNTGSCKFRWIEFFPDYYQLNNKSDEDGNITRRISNYNHYVQGNPKSLHRGNVVLDAATHYAYKMVDGYRTKEVSSNVAYFAHIRHGKNPPKNGLKIGVPRSTACMDHVISKILVMLMVLLCVAWQKQLNYVFS